MATFFIEAFDTLFFRDGRPFEVGGEANLLIPPPSSTFYGAFRSALISATPDGWQKFHSRTDQELTAWVGEKGDSEGFTARLAIKGPVFARIHEDQVERFFIMPRDLLVYSEKDNNENEHYFLVPLVLKEFEEPFSMNMGLSHILVSPYSRNVAYKEWFIHENLFKQYLAGKLSFPYEFEKGKEVLEPREIFSSDYRVGIALKAGQKNAEGGRLFTMQHMAFRNENGKRWCFWVDVKWPDAMNREMILRLGGDGKVARMQPVTTKSWEVQGIQEKIQKNGLFKVYLATPAIFELGWKSRAMHNTYFNDISELQFELLTAALGRAQMFGGYDIVANVPKISFPAVPAGSVFYFKLKKGNAEQVMQAFHDRCIADFRKNQGFGYAFVGGITHV